MSARQLGNLMTSAEARVISGFAWLAAFPVYHTIQGRFRRLASTASGWRDPPPAAQSQRRFEPVGKIQQATLSLDFVWQG
jgi:hypothetical protein